MYLSIVWGGENACVIPTARTQTFRGVGKALFETDQIAPLREILVINGWDEFSIWYN